MGVSKNSGTPKSYLLIGFSWFFHYFHHPFWGFSPYFHFSKVIRDQNFNRRSCEVIHVVNFKRVPTEIPKFRSNWMTKTSKLRQVVLKKIGSLFIFNNQCLGSLTCMGPIFRIAKKVATTWKTHGIRTIFLGNGRLGWF